nr:hypothetical protein [Tanacetum cinerariifolium]
MEGIRLRSKMEGRMMKPRFLDSRGGEKKKKINDAELSEKGVDVNVLSTLAVVDLSKLAAEFPSLETSNRQHTNGEKLDAHKPESIRAISERFSNTTYGFFLGKQMAYPIVALCQEHFGMMKPRFLDSRGGEKKKKINDAELSEKGVDVNVLSTLAVVDLSKLAAEFPSLETSNSQPTNGEKLDAHKPESIRAISERFSNTTYGFFLGKQMAYPVVALCQEHFGCTCCKVFGHVQEECIKNIGVSETKKMPSQTPKGVQVGQKVGFKPKKQVYQPVSKKPTANTSENKKKNVKPIKEVGSSGDYDSEDEVASLDNKMASFVAKKDGCGTQSLLEQWNESYENDDYKYDPYDDDMYEGHEIPDKLQTICDNLDIKVRGLNVSKRRAFWSLNEDILKIIDFDIQYAVSIKEDMAYPCLHSPKTTKETSSIRRILVSIEIGKNDQPLNLNP